MKRDLYEEAIMWKGLEKLSPLEDALLEEVDKLRETVLLLTTHASFCQGGDCFCMDAKGLAADALEMENG